MGSFAPIRDAVETVGSLAGNYILPGSSLVTDKLVSKGAQSNLNSTLGKVAQIGTGLAGSGFGQGFTGIPSASDVGGGWTNAANKVGGLFGNGSLGTDVGTFAGGLSDKVTSGFSDAASGIGRATGLSDLLSGSGSTSAADNAFLNSAKLSSQGFSPADIGFMNSANASGSFGAGGGASSYGAGGGGIGGIQGIGTLLGAANSLSANDKAQKDLLDAQNNALSQLQPYQATGVSANNKLSQLLGTSPSDNGQTASDILAASPQYQFQLQQGNQALDRQQAAKGNYFSGAALKQAQDYGQGLASQTAQQYYNNLAQQSGQGANVAGTAAGINENTGNAKAAAGISSSNILNQTLSSLLGGSGAKKPINIGGQVYYV